MKEKETRLAWNLYVEATDGQFTTKELNLGPWTSYSLINDPKPWLLFYLATSSVQKC